MRLGTIYRIVFCCVSVAAMMHQNRNGFWRSFDPGNSLGQQTEPAKNNKNGKDGHANWDYGENGHGPEFWPELFPSRCGGLYQSPVDIVTDETVYQPSLKEFVFTYPSSISKFVLHCNGHTVQVNTEGDFYMYGGGLPYVYKTAQFHFHWGDNSQYGAEHTIDGIEYPLEMHIVNWNSDKYKSLEEAAKHRDGVAVLAVIFEVSRYDNPGLEPIVNTIPHVRDPDWDKRIDMKGMSIRNLVPREGDKYFRYHGSLTTPTCLQSVVWSIFDQKLPISERQLRVFRTVLKHKSSNNSPPGLGQGFVIPEEPATLIFGRQPLVNNYRPIQPLNGRTVYRSFQYHSPEHLQDLLP